MPWADVEQVDAVVAFLTSKVHHLGPDGGKAAAYDLPDVPQPFPRMYLEVYVERITGSDPRRMGLGVGQRHWRITTRSVASTAYEVRVLQSTLFAAQHEPIPDLGSDGYVAEAGGDSTPQPDDGAYSARNYWTYTT